MSKRPRDDSSASAVKHKAKDALDMPLLRDVKGWDDVKQLFGVEEEEEYADIKVDMFLERYKERFMNEAKAATITKKADDFIHECKQHTKRLKVREEEPRSSPELPHDVDERARLLLQLLEDIQGSPAKHKPSSRALAANWDVRDRASAEEKILEATRNNLQRFQEEDTEKRHWNAVVITGAAGSGKTTLCHKAFGWIEEAGLAVSRVMSVFITFLNGEQLTSADCIQGVDQDTQASIALGIRMANKLFPKLEVCSEMTLRSFRASLGEYAVLCDLRTVTRACSLHLKTSGEENPAWITLVLDEAHFAEHPEREDAPRFWPAIMSTLKEYLIPGEDRGFGLADCIVLFPIISSTWSVERKKNHWSPGVPIFPPLPALSFDSVEFLVGNVATDHQHIGVLWDEPRMRHFLVSCALIPDGLALALETAIRLRDIELGELTKQICLAFSNRFKPGEQLQRELAEVALSGVVVQNLGVELDGEKLTHWLACGFASGTKGSPLSIPFPALFNEGGLIVPGLSQFTNFGQPFHWQDFEELVPHIIRLRCSSLYRLKANHQATLAEIFGSGPPTTVSLREDMAVVTCSKQWLVAKRGKIDTIEKQLKVKTSETNVTAGNAGALAFGSLAHVFAAADGNVHFDGKASFQTEDQRSVLVCYQVKHTHIDPSKNLKHFTWTQVETWLTKARTFMDSYGADVKLFVMITNKEVRTLPAQMPPDFVLIHSGNLATFFAPCLLASARLAQDDADL